MSVNVKGKYILVSFHINRPVVQLREFLPITRVFSAVSAFPNWIIYSALTVSYLGWRTSPSILKPHGLLWPLETPAFGHPLKDVCEPSLGFSARDKSILAL